MFLCLKQVSIFQTQYIPTLLEAFFFIKPQMLHFGDVSHRWLCYCAAVACGKVIFHSFHNRSKSYWNPEKKNQNHGILLVLTIIKFQRFVILTEAQFQPIAQTSKKILFANKESAHRKVGPVYDMSHVRGFFRSTLSATSSTDRSVYVCMSKCCCLYVTVSGFCRNAVPAVSVSGLSAVVC